MPQAGTTRRAYTLHITGLDRNDNSWRQALWSTHKAVNLGAKVFGDWLLTLRGGISHELAQNIEEKQLKAADEEIRNRRVLLALSWLSVESRRGAPFEYLVPQEEDGRWKTVEALREILRKRGVAEPEIDLWVKDCEDTLEASIRDDAVWVNRSLAFDKAAERIGSSLTREEIWDILGRFFGGKDAYLRPLVITAEDEDGAETSKQQTTEDTEDDSAPGLIKQAIRWLSDRFGQGKGANFERLAQSYEKIATWAGSARPNRTGGETIESLAENLKTPPGIDNVLAVISGPGYKSKTRNLLKEISVLPVVEEARLQTLRKSALKDRLKCLQKIGKKGCRPYSDSILRHVVSKTGMEYRPIGGATRQQEYSVILDHAARHLVIAHTWLKRAEAVRLRFAKDAEKLSEVPQAAREWLDGYCQMRAEMTESLGDYLIRRRAVVGWGQVVKAWSQEGCSTVADRIAAVRELQGELEKFGDVNLFSELAADDATCVWQQNDGPAPEILFNYVAATNARASRRRFKVPAYRHPDPLWHPVFCDFGNSRWRISFAAYEQKKKSKTRQRRMTPDNKRGLRMHLWTGEDLQELGLQWQSKRLTRDLALSQVAPPADVGVLGVSRADRLGRAAAGANNVAPVELLGLYDPKTNWNGRLQAPRYELERLGSYLEAHGLSYSNEDDWDDKARAMRDRIGWLLTFSVPLQPRGPWMEYASVYYLSPDPQVWPHSGENKKRKERARLILSRFPGLRVVSVDLGHRYAAACAVWETVTAEQVMGACAAAGQAGPSPDSLYLHLRGVDGKTTIYRRIAGDTLPDGTPHPAPWARLDRQFLIKLQGEGEPARKASPAEMEMVRSIEASIGYLSPDRRSWQVDELAADAVETLRRGLKRHGLRARIGFSLLESTRTEAGKLAECTKRTTDALVDWYTLFTSRDWNDEWARGLWERMISPLLPNKQPPALDDSESAPVRKKRQEELKNLFRSAAEKLSREDCLNLYDIWKQRWQRDDADWKHYLRQVRDWILPRGRGDNTAAIMRKGGLSLTRIATMRSLYLLQKAYAMRPEPDDMQKNLMNNRPDFGRSILGQMEELRQNRVKQLASRIVEAALGVGIEGTSSGERERKRPRERISDARFAPCHAVVVENLTHYRTDQIRTRRENRQLMTWSAGKIKRYLQEACLLHGLHFREVNPRYTSRQDSRTGAAGRRCTDVPVEEFICSGGYWEQKVNKAKERLEQGGSAAEDRLLCELYACWDKNKKTWRDERGALWALQEDGSWQVQGNAGSAAGPRPVRLPREGGEIFVSSEPTSPAARGIQADLNAAANIGLRALLDPDWPGSWWYVPCGATTGKPVDAEIKGSHVFRNVSTLAANGNSGSKKKNDIVNLWCDISAAPLDDQGRGEWQSSAEYWSRVDARVIRVLRSWAGLVKRYDQ
ncbi:MAG: type V CRISPR-associated protein Cas12b [bacterium]